MELKTDKLVLEPQKRVKQEIIDKYQELIDVVCGKGDERDTNPFFFQKQAVVELISYFLNYRDLNELLGENLAINNELNEYYKEIKPKFDDLSQRIATIDLPTGTGKSYVMFLIAIILLNEHPEINRIQVITPSKTIKKQLRGKFEELFEKIKTIQGLNLPNIVSLHEEVLADNCLAIDNIHKFYETENAVLAKEESFGNGKGANVLVINDEAHHIYNFNQGANPRSNEYEDIKKWREFLNNPDYKIKNIINFTATPFEAKDIYFHNVIYRYGLMEAIKNKVIKDIRYLPEGNENLSEIEAEKQQFVLAIKQLKDIKDKFKKNSIKIKPIGIIITADIAEAKRVEEKFKRILKDQRETAIDEKVICYTSDPEHLKNEELFDNVDIYEGNKANKVEWIISVSMLSEGWDCKNVFLIVPHQERAFNSKLLISQVVGRGVRRIPKLDDEYQEVLVLNHKKWGDDRINLLINEVVDTTIKFEIKPTGNFNFEVDYLEEQSEPFELKANKEVGKKVSLKKVLDRAVSQFQEQTKEVEIIRKTKELEKGGEGIIEADIEKDYYPKEYLANWYSQGVKLDNDFTNKFKNEEEFVDYIFDSKIIKKSKIKDKILIYNFNKLVDEFSNIDWGVKEDKQDKKEKKYKILSKNTKDFGVSYVGVKTFLDDYEKSFYCPEIIKLDKWEYLDDLINYKLKEQKRALKITDNKKDKILSELSKSEVLNKFTPIKKENYKNPLNFILFESEPEEKFIERLFLKNKNIGAWIKSKSRGFYFIDCSKDDEKIEFNPDFIIKTKDDNYLLVEIKDRNDLTLKNRLKLEGLLSYLKLLNSHLHNKQYYGFIISQNDYDNFFTEILGNGNYSYEPEFHNKLKNLK